MKKIFTLTLVFLAMMFGVNAQYLLQEGFETGTLPTGWTTVDNDGDGYTWDASFLYQNEGAAHAGDGMIASASYINNLGALTPDNWLISPAVNLTANSNLTFWVKGQDGSYFAENYSVYVATSNTVAAFTATTAVLTGTTTNAWEQKTVDLSSYTGQTVYIAFRHHDITDMYWLDLDDVEIFAQPTDPTIAANPSTVNFGTVLLGNSANATVNVSAYNLTAAITATTAAPFAVSADGTTFGTTASIATAGGTLYVQYTPTAVGTDNGTVTLSSTGATDATINLSGTGLDCSNITIPFTEGFESTIDCWTMVSMDPANDDRFGVYEDPNAFEGNYDFRFSSYSSASDYNQYLITPELTLNANETYFVKFHYKGYNSSENFKVMYSTTNNSISSFTELSDYTNVATSWTEVTLQLPAGTKYVAIDYYGNYQYYLYVDNFSIITSTPTMSLNPHALDFGTVPMGTASASQAVVMNIININEDFTLTTTAPFEISLDGTTFANTQTIPANTAIIANETFYVRFTPTAVGTYNQELYVTSTNFSDTLTLTGDAIDCSSNTLPYTTNFDNESQNLCWEIIDANNDGRTFNFSTSDGFAYYQYHSSNVADDWLISPVFTLTGEQFCYLDYAAYSATYSPEKFQVFAIDANNTQTALTDVIETSSTSFQTQTIDLTSLTGNYRIGIHCVSDPDKYYLLINNFNVNNNIPAASLTLSAEALDFGTIPAGNTSMTKTVVMNTINVNEAFTLSTSAPFEISLDGTNFATTQTIPANATMVVNDNIYVRFAPTAAGTFNQNLTISSTTQNATIALNGNAADCANSAITNFPFVNNFNDGFPVCWGYNDPDNYIVANVDEQGTDQAIGCLGIDMLVTPEITSTSDMALMFDYRGYLGDNLEGMDPTTFRVGYSSTNSDAASFTWLETVNVDAYPEEGVVFFNYINTIPANAKYVAIDFTYFASLDTWLGTYEDVVYIDNFRLITDGDIFVNPESLNFGSIIAGNTSSPKTATVTTALLTSNISVTAPANFEVSANGASYAATATLPETGGTLYVRYNPSAAGFHSGTITVTSGTTTKTIAVSGNAVDCSAPQTLPFTEDFENGMPTCWTILDQDGDGYSWEDSYNPVSYYSGSPFSGEGNNGSEGFVLSGSYSNALGSALTPDNWLITPALVIPSNGAKLTWYVAAIDADYAAEYYDVMLSTSLNPSTFTSVFNETLQSDQWEQRTVNINGNYAGQNVYVAFRNHNTSDIFLMRIDDINVTAIVGVNEFTAETTIFPNPANNVLNINANSNINRVEVYNMMGQMVGMYEVNDTNTQISTSNFANGVYTLRIATENGTSTKKFTVAR